MLGLFTKACFIGATLLLAGPLLGVLESTMLSHVLIQFPILIAIGIVLGDKSRMAFAPLLKVCNGGGIAGILIATFTLAFWMIPRWLDAALNDHWVGVAKYLSLVMLVGVPLAWSWSRLHFIARSVVKIEFLTMLFRLGWLYLISPDRLCNNYLLKDQTYLGYGFLILAVSLAISWLIPVFFGSPSEQRYTAKA